MRPWRGFAGHEGGRACGSGRSPATAHQAIDRELFGDAHVLEFTELDKDTRASSWAAPHGLFLADRVRPASSRSALKGKTVAVRGPRSSPILFLATCLNLA